MKFLKPKFWEQKKSLLTFFYYPFRLFIKFFFLLKENLQQ